MSVYKPATSRYWQYDFQYQGRRFHGSTGVENRRSAEEVERRKRRAAALGELDTDDIPTLEQAASAWWRDHAQHLRTADTLWRRIGTTLRLLGKATKITDIDQAAVARAIQKRRRETFAKAPRKIIDGRRVEPVRYPVAPATVNADVINVLRRILKHAAAGGPAGLARRLPDIDWKALRLAEPEPKFRMYSAAQRAAWRGQCDETAAFALDLLLTYGLRFGELFFDPAAYLPGDEAEGIGPHLLIDKRKRGLLFLPLRQDDARQIAARAGQAIAANLTSIWIERGPKGRLTTVPYYGLQTRLRSAARRANLTLARMIHGARHHAGTILLHRTQNPRVTQQLLGHADPRSSARYAHVLTQDLRAALDQESRNSPEPPTGAPEFTPPKQRRRP